MNDRLNRSNNSAQFIPHDSRLRFESVNHVQPMPSTDKTDHPHFRDHLLTGHDSDIPKSTRMTPERTSRMLKICCAIHLQIPSKRRKQPIMMSLQSLNWSGDRTCARSLDSLLTATVWAAGIFSRWRAVRL